MKIVVNRSTEGFSLSIDAVKLLASWDHEHAKTELERLPSFRGYRSHALLPYTDRSDDRLVRVVEALGKKANGLGADLAIVEIPNGIRWQIREENGMEHVEEEHRRWHVPAPLMSKRAVTKWVEFPFDNTGGGPIPEGELWLLLGVARPLPPVPYPEGARFRMIINHEILFIDRLVEEIPIFYQPTKKDEPVCSYCGGPPMLPIKEGILAIMRNFHYEIEIASGNEVYSRNTTAYFYVAVVKDRA